MPTRNRLLGLRTLILFCVSLSAIATAALLLIFVIPQQEKWIKNGLEQASMLSLKQFSAAITSPLLTKQYASLYETIETQKSLRRNWVRVRVTDENRSKIYPLSDWENKLKPGDKLIRHSILFENKLLGHVDVVTNFDKVIRNASSAHYKILSVQLILMSLTSIAVYLILQSYIVTPLRRLVTGFKTLAEGNFSHVAPKAYENEIGDVIKEFTKMQRSIFKQQLRLEHLKEQAELANRAKSDFLSSMSHELRTPLNVILGFAQLTNFDKNATPSQREQAQSIYQAGKHLLQLVNGMLDLTGIESGSIKIKNTNVDIHKTIDESIQLLKPLADQENIKLVFKPATDYSPIVHADRTKLNQVLFNLLSNAVKYNQAEGLVTVEVELSDQNAVTICITDTGKGLSKNQLDNLFTPFERLGAENSNTLGTGIGLVVTKELTELMNGKISVQSTVGLGSRFTIEFPLLEVSAPNQALALENDDAISSPSPSAACNVSAKTKLLAVEDSKPNQMLIEMQFSTLGYDAVIADNGEDACKRLGETEFDVVLTDIQMPKMDGIELLKCIRASDNPKISNLPVIAVTASVMGNDIKKYLELGFDDCIAKPIDISKLEKAVNALKNSELTVANDTSTKS